MAACLLAAVASGLRNENPGCLDFSFRHHISVGRPFLKAFPFSPAKMPTYRKKLFLLKPSPFSALAVAAVIKASSSVAGSLGVLPHVLPGLTRPVTLSDNVDFGTLKVSAALRTDMPLLTALTASVIFLSNHL
jgi:hypothetical protein